MSTKPFESGGQPPARPPRTPTIADIPPSLPTPPPREPTDIDALFDEVRRAKVGTPKLQKPGRASFSPYVAFRPHLRPPTPLLCIVDDGRETGEWVRLRSDRTVIGRGPADVAIPHDELMSARHAEIVRTSDGTSHSWTLVDLGSSNGTYVRVRHARLSPGALILVGQTRLRFDPPPAVGLPKAPDEPIPTISWDMMQPSNLMPSLVRIVSGGDGERTLMESKQNWIGRAPGNAIVVGDDPYVADRHAYVATDPKGRWAITEGEQPSNGVWVRFNEIRLSALCAFQLGEQRFIFRLP